MKSRWDTHWQEKKLRDVSLEIKQVKQSNMTKKIHTVLRQEFGSLSRINSIEIGSGLGLDSLVLAMNGAKVTLLDYSGIALANAQQVFNKYGITPTLISSDVFSIKSSLKGNFDVAMSFGLAEHYWGDGRILIIKAHLDLVKPNGIIIISVPNRYCPPYQVAKLVQRWDEEPFTKRELRGFCDKLDCEVIFIGGFGLFNYISLTISRILKTDEFAFLNTPRFIDNSLGSALILIARKKNN